MPGSQATSAAVVMRPPLAFPLPIPDMIKHVTLALSAHVRRLHRDALPVPREVEELALFLMHLARTRHDTSPVVDPSGHAHNDVMPDRLLVTKGEAARRLGVSVRTVERLMANGRLPQVHVERLARIRVSDLEAFADGLGQCQMPPGTAPDHHSEQHSPNERIDPTWR